MLVCGSVNIRYEAPLFIECTSPTSITIFNWILLFGSFLHILHFPLKTKLIQSKSSHRLDEMKLDPLLSYRFNQPYQIMCWIKDHCYLDFNFLFLERTETKMNLSQYYANGNLYWRKKKNCITFHWTIHIKAFSFFCLNIHDRNVWIAFRIPYSMCSLFILN